MADEPAPPARRFGISLLGPLLVSRDGLPLDPSSWPKRSRSLLLLLATAPEQRRLRDELIDLLWPDSLPEQGASNLRKAVHQLRKGLGELDPSHLLVERGWVALNPTYTWEIDLTHFEAVIRREEVTIAQLEEGLGLYRGEPLAEERYEDWATPIRERIERTWREGCLRLAELDRTAGRPEEAVRWLERLLAHDPLDEGVVQQVLGALAEMGRRTEGVRLYQQFARRLKEELDLEPAGETVALVERLKVESGQAIQTPAALTREVDEGGEGAALRPPPSDLRTFLLADIRGYSRFSEEQGDEAAARLVGKYAALATEVVAARGGEVIELRGDEALVAFGSARDALRAALELQRRCAQETEIDPSLPLRVGMGVDIGERIAVEGGYRGGALGVAARLCSLAAPGEVFASESVVQTARKMAGYQYLERGEVQLKGLPHLVRVIQVVPEDAIPEDLPQFTVNVTQTSNLPPQPLTNDN